MAPTLKSAEKSEPPEESTQVATTHEQIAALAYVPSSQCCCPEGSPEVDWFEAEAELFATVSKRS